MSVGTTLKQVSERIWAGTPSLEVLKAGLDGVFENLFQWEESLPMAGGSEQDCL